MKLIDRYLGSQVLLSATFAVGVLSLVLVLGNIFQKIFELLVNHDVPMEFILSFIAYVLPFSLSFTIPWGVLTAILLVFGRLSAENELTAFRASGVSILRLCVPVFALATLFSLICLWINLDVAPRAQQKMKSTLYNIATSNPISLFSSDQIIDDFPGRKIYVGNKDGNFLEDVMVFELDARNTPIRVVYAKKGKLEVGNLAPASDATANSTVNEGDQKIILRLYDARYEQRDEADPLDLRKISHGITMSEGVISISLKELYEKNRKRRGASSMTLAELNSAGNGAPTGVSASAILTEKNKRFSYSLACIAFALIAVPLGITAQRRETSIGFAISLVVALIYFLFIIFADTFRNNPAAYPHLLIWLPNVLFLALGGVLFARLARR